MARYIEKIIVDTDSRQIISLIEKNFPNVAIINRPAHLIGDKIPMNAIIDNDINHVETEHIFQTHSTNPFLKQVTIDNAIETYFNSLPKGFDSAMSVTRYQSRFYDNNRQPINHDPEIMLPTQDLPPLYEDNSNFYIISVYNFRRLKRRVGNNPKFIEVSRLENIDIDEEEDFILAEAIFDFMHNKKQIKE